MLKLLLYPQICGWETHIHSTVGLARLRCHGDLSLLEFRLDLRVGLDFLAAPFILTSVV